MCSPFAATVRSGVILALRAGRGAADKALGALGEGLRRDLIAVEQGESTRVRRGSTGGRGRRRDPRPGRGCAHRRGRAGDAGYERARSISAADVRLRGVIALLRDDPRVQQFAETELRALVASDLAGDGISNVDLLRQYLQLAGNKAALAQRLHISRPTLYRRLAAIAEILGVDLEDAESMTSLHVAMLILDARRIPSAGSTGLPG